MSNDTLHIPVRATMTRQPDGSYRMTDAEYADIPAAVVAKWLIDRLGAPVEEGQMKGNGRCEQTRIRRTD